MTTNRPNRSYVLTFLLALTITLGAAGSTQADLILFTYQPSYTLKGVGDTAEIQVLLRQEGAPIIEPGNELISAAIAVAFDNPLGIAAVLADDDITPGGSFDSADAAAEATQAELAQVSLFGLTLPEPRLLGTFRFTAQSLGTTTIQVTDLDPSTADFSSVNNPNIDDLVQETTATITVVPEPSMRNMLAITFPVVGLLVHGLRRRRHRKIIA